MAGLKSIVNYSDPFGLTGCKVQSICDALDTANRWASALLGRSVQSQMDLEAGWNIPLPKGMKAQVATRSKLTLTRTGDGSSVVAAVRGNILIRNAPKTGWLKLAPDPLIHEAAVDLGSGEFGVKGDVLIGFEVTGNLREGDIDVKIGPFKKHIELPEDEKEKKPK